MRRARRFGRRFRKPVARVRQAWMPGVFGAQSQAIDGTLTEWTLFDPTLVQVTNTYERLKVRRIHYSGGLSLFPKALTFNRATNGLYQYVYVIDQDDTDASVLTSAQGSILRSNRVLYTRCIPLLVNEAPTEAQYGASNATSSTLDLSFDIKFQAWVRPDELIVMGVQLFATAAGDWIEALHFGVLRTLYDIP